MVQGVHENFSLWQKELAGLALCSGQEWLVLKHNPHLAAMLNCTGSDLLGMSLEDILQQCGFEQIMPLLAFAQEKKPFFFHNQDMLWSISWQYCSKEKEKVSSEVLRLLLFQEFPFYNASQASICFHSEFDALLDALHDGVWLINSEGITLRVNKAMLNMIEMQESELVGKHVSAPMLQGKYSACVTLRALEEQKSVTMFDDYANGKRFLNTSTPIFDDTGKVWRVIACIRDMSILEEMQNRLNTLESSNKSYKNRIKELEQTSNLDFIGTSPAMQKLVQDIKKTARADAIGLILGETGTGKSLAAHTIHKSSPRCEDPFVSINCGAIPADLLESELFGYEKGAFTGAHKSGKKGLFESAKSGTIFLDEIAELPLNMQVKLLHVLDRNTFTPVGSVEPKHLYARILAATNKSLEKMVAEGTFREDLFYRLNVLSVYIPPLRERPEDIASLVKYFFALSCKKAGGSKRLSPEVLECFTHYQWPGNVRELRTTIEYLTTMAESDCIQLSDLPSRFQLNLALDKNVSVSLEKLPLKEALAQLEKTMLCEALHQSGSTWKAAKKLGISQSSVVRKAQKYKLGLAEIVHS